MKRDRKRIVCPSCGDHGLDIKNFNSLMVLKPGLGLFSLSCPSCGAIISTIQPIPQELDPCVKEAAGKVGAGMGVVS